MTAPLLRAAGLSAWFGAQQSLREVDLVCPGGDLTALIGPTGGGKSTLLRVASRLAEERAGFRRTGTVYLGDDDVYAASDPTAVRRRAVLLLDTPALFRGSVFDNVAFGPRLAGVTDRAELARRVEQALRAVALWEDLETRLGDSPRGLAAGEQQRLCLARCLALRPQLLLLDDPTRTLDPVETGELEEVLLALRGTHTIVLACRTAQQAGRLADVTAFLDGGELVEAGATEDLFTRPRRAATQAYLSRRYA